MLEFSGNSAGLNPKLHSLNIESTSPDQPKNGSQGRYSKVHVRKLREPIEIMRINVKQGKTCHLQTVED